MAQSPRYRTSFATSVAAAFITMAATCVGTVVHWVTSASVTAWNWAWQSVRERFLRVAARFKQERLVLPERVDAVQACAYALKLAKRDRPQVRDRWRMCPSV